MEKNILKKSYQIEKKKKSSKLNITSRESEIEIKIKPCKNL